MRYAEKQTGIARTVMSDATDGPTQIHSSCLADCESACMLSHHHQLQVAYLQQFAGHAHANLKRCMLWRKMRSETVRFSWTVRLCGATARTMPFTRVLGQDW